MTTSQTSNFLDEILSGGVIPRGKLAYFRQRLRNKLHAIVLSEFDARERSGELTKAELARRIGKAPEQITRWLTAPGNWTLDTVSDLMLGMGAEPQVAAAHLGTPTIPTFTFITPNRVIGGGVGGNIQLSFISWDSTPPGSGLLHGLGSSPFGLTGGHDFSIAIGPYVPDQVEATGPVAVGF